MKDKIFSWLDRNYPIDRKQDNLIDISFDEEYPKVVEKVFGVTNNYFDLWKDNRCDNLYGYKYSNGTKHWYLYGKLHRENDKPAVIYADGDKTWYQNGKVHRDNDLPAMITYYGTKFWYQNGLRHRDNDKPAIIYASGKKTYYKDGKKYTPNEK